MGALVHLEKWRVSPALGVFQRLQEGDAGFCRRTLGWALCGRHIRWGGHTLEQRGLQMPGVFRNPWVRSPGRANDSDHSPRLSYFVFAAQT